MADKWVTWDGGPHLLLPERALADWDGGRPPKRGRVIEAKFRYQKGEPATDYDRACDVDDLIGKIDVGGYDALVLGDDVPMSTLVRLDDGALCVFVPMVWSSADSFRQDALPSMLAAVTECFVDTGLLFQHAGGCLMLQPAAVAGDEPEVRVAECLADGRYHVWWGAMRTSVGEFRAF